jgi:hypothetical protein
LLSSNAKFKARKAKREISPARMIRCEKSLSRIVTSNVMQPSSQRRCHAGVSRLQQVAEQLVDDDPAWHGAGTEQPPEEAFGPGLPNQSHRPYPLTDKAAQASHQTKRGK